MTNTSEAARTARRSQRRRMVRAGRHEARSMIRTGAFDAMATFERAIRRTDPRWTE